GFRMLGGVNGGIGMWGARPGACGVIVVLGGPLARRSRYAAPAAGETSRSLCPEVDVQNHLILVLDRPQGGAIGLVTEARLLERKLGPAAEEASVKGDLDGKLDLPGHAAGRELARDEETTVGLLADRTRRECGPREARGGELVLGLHRRLAVGALLGRRLSLQSEFSPDSRVVGLERSDLDLHLDRRGVRPPGVVG